MYLFLKAVKFKILFLIVLTSISFGVGGYIFTKNTKEYMSKNWIKYRNKLYVQPFAGIIKPVKGETFTETNIKNIQKIQYKSAESFFKMFMQPLTMMIGVILKIFNQMRNSLDKIRNMFYKVKVSILQFVAEFMNRLSNLFASMLETFSRTRDILERMKGIYTVLIYMLWTVYNFLEWLVKTLFKLIRAFVLLCIALLAGILWLVFWPFAPIVAYFAVLLGIAGSGFTICFDKNTLIKMYDGSYKKICEIDIGEKLRGGGQILSVIKSEIKNKLMYNYNGIVVSGDHLVFDSGSWRRVKDCTISTKITNYEENYIYCLATSNNLIPTITTVFRDFNETNIPSIRLFINKLILSYLNKNEFNIVTKKFEEVNIGENGFDENTEIEMDNGNINYIKDIKFGDVLKNGKKIIGIIKIDASKVKPYRYFLNNTSVVLSGSQLVLENGIWINVFNSSNSIKILKYPKKYFYNLITYDNLLEINNTMFRDYLEVGDININKKIDTFVETYLNS